MSLIDTSNLAIDESLLTGDSVAVTKRAMGGDEATAADVWTAFRARL
jgi:Ca2+-transporting ATPase